MDANFDIDTMNTSIKEEGGLYDLEEITDQLRILGDKSDDNGMSRNIGKREMLSDIIRYFEKVQGYR